MSKRTRAAADFLQRKVVSTVATTSASSSSSLVIPSSSSVQASKKSRQNDGSASATAASNPNYTPTAIASLRALVEKDGGNPNVDLALSSTTNPTLTQFQRRVYALTKRIPAGRVATYKSIAISLNSPNSCRAVGNSLRHNPYAPMVPCHRVIPSDGSIGGFAGATAANSALVQKKIAMLKAEGIEFEPNSSQLRKDEKYRASVVLQQVSAEDIDMNLKDEHLKM